MRDELAISSHFLDCKQGCKSDIPEEKPDYSLSTTTKIFGFLIGASDARFSEEK
jgi:hypothetical protein